MIRHSKSDRSRPAVATFIQVEDNPPRDDPKGPKTGQRRSAPRACSSAHDRPPTRADPSSALGTSQRQTRLLFHDTGVGHELGTISTPQAKNVSESRRLSGADIRFNLSPRSTASRQPVALSVSFGMADNEEASCRLLLDRARRDALQFIPSQPSLPAVQHPSGELRSFASEVHAR